MLLNVDKIVPLDHFIFGLNVLNVLELAGHSYVASSNFFDQKGLFQ